jgi:hypothetical protein
MKNKLILWLVLLLVGFLVGFVPQYTKAQRARSELESVKQQLSVCQLGNRLSQLRDSAALMYLEATRKNYGLAGEYATRFFEEAHQVAEQTSDPGLRAQLQDLLTSRDEALGKLAQGDAGILPQLQTLLTKTLQNVKR